MTPPHFSPSMNASHREPEPVQVPTYVPLGRGLAIGGLGLVVPVALCLVVLMAGMQMAAEACYLNGCERRLMKAFSWCWPVMGASAVTGIVARAAAQPPRQTALRARDPPARPDGRSVCHPRRGSPSLTRTPTTAVSFMSGCAAQQQRARLS
ncbi:hypothetical protein [Streptomyces ehimensis]|uniref:Transmembrane protein n=1 Tax=Streptomyces ehimensis TaxID=68195 RepID=A0ABV9BVE3_9ACTN